MKVASESESEMGKLSDPEDGMMSFSVVVLETVRVPEFDFVFGFLFGFVTESICCCIFHKQSTIA